MYMHIYSNVHDLTVLSMYSWTRKKKKKIFFLQCKTDNFLKIKYKGQVLIFWPQASGLLLIPACQRNECGKCSKISNIKNKRPPLIDFISSPLKQREVTNFANGIASLCKIGYFTECLLFSFFWYCFDFCFMALQHILGHFGGRQLSPRKNVPDLGKLGPLACQANMLPPAIFSFLLYEFLEHVPVKLKQKKQIIAQKRKSNCSMTFFSH